MKFTATFLAFICLVANAAPVPSEAGDLGERALVMSKREPFL